MTVMGEVFMIHKELQNNNTQFQMGVEGSSHLTTITIGQGIIVGNHDHGTQTPTLLHNEVTHDILKSGIFIIEKKIQHLYPDLIASIPAGRFYTPTLSPETTMGDSSEGIKVWDTLEGVLTFLLDAHTTRETPVVSIGGGALTDIAGLASSIYMRGTPLYTIPTTLLGMVDSAIGGKTAINFQDTKNVIGTFHHPTEVIVDINFLQTLSRVEIVCGLMEVIKLGIILDCDLFDFVDANMDNILKLEPASITHIITKSLRIKGETVRVDSSDQNERLKLNFGHTIAHAIEGDSMFTIPHGIAVGMGMYWELCLVEFLHSLYADAGAGVDADAGAGADADAGVDADADADAGVGAGADADAGVGADADAGVGVGAGAGAGAGAGVGADADAGSGSASQPRPLHTPHSGVRFRIDSINMDDIARIKGHLQRLLRVVDIDPLYTPRSRKKFVSTLLNDKKNLPHSIVLPLIHSSGVATLAEVAISDVVDFCNQHIFCPPQTEGNQQ